MTVDAGDADDWTAAAPPPQALSPTAKNTIANEAMRRLGGTIPTAAESSRSMLTNPNGFIEASEAACVDFTTSVVEAAFVPLRFKDVGLKEHCADIGNPAHESVTVPEKPLRGVSCRPTEAGWLAETVRPLLLVENPKSGAGGGVTAPIANVAAFDM